MKTTRQILKKLNIDQLNEMQLQTGLAVEASEAVVLLSPTGTGKTLAFLLPLLNRLDAEIEEVQALIVVPSRELAIQIEQVCREMGSGYKVNAVYGGQAGAKDKANLVQPPAILIGTPGRLLDHLERGSFSTEYLRTLVLDEFDKSLETGFEEQMTAIVEALPMVDRKVLTSATEGVVIPDFVGLNNPLRLTFLSDEAPKLKLQAIEVPRSNKLPGLTKLLGHIGEGHGIIFCNFKDSIQSVSTYLDKHGIKHATFHGGLEQQDRERALIKFRNGTASLLLATDLAARGIDVPALDFIIHYELPLKEEEFTHRNGRTARMHQSGTAYLLKWAERDLPDFMSGVEMLSLENSSARFSDPNWRTLFVSGGRRDKISKGDIAGWLFRQGDLGREEVGQIELKQECAFVAITGNKAVKIAADLDNSRLKKRKVRVYVI